MKLQTTSLLRLIVLDSKSLNSRGKKIQQPRVREALGKLYGPEKNSTSTALQQRWEYNYRSQTTSCYIQKRHGNIITKTTMNSTKNTSIQNENHT